MSESLILDIANIQYLNFLISLNFKLYFFASEALFGLDKNGTDMPFFHKDTIIVPEMIESLKNHPAVAKRVRCSIFDWGDRCKNPSNHYKKFIDYCNEAIKKEKDQNIREELTSIKEKAAVELNRLKERL